MSNRPKLHNGRFMGTDSNGNDRYAADYYLKHEVDEYITELEAQLVEVRDAIDPCLSVDELIAKITAAIGEVE